MEQIRFESFLVDDKVIYFQQAVYGGLYELRDKKDISKILTSKEMFKYGVFSTSFIQKWKDEIIIVPLDAEMPWIIHNICTKETKYKKIEGLSGKIRGVEIRDDFAYLIPATPDTIACVVNLNCLTRVQRSLPHDKAVTKSGISNLFAWSYYYEREKVFLAYRGASDIWEFSMSDWETPRKIELSLQVCVLDFCIKDDFFWIYPESGDALIIADLTGNIISSITIPDDMSFCPGNFARIISEEKTIILIPINDEGFLLYNTQKEKWTVIKPENSEISVTMEKDDAFAYWWYFKEEDYLVFPSYGRKWIELDVNNMKYIQRDISFPIQYEDKLVDDYFEKVVKKLTEDKITHETTGYDLKALVAMNLGKNRNNSNSIKRGDYIWEKIYR